MVINHIAILIGNSIVGMNLNLLAALLREQCLQTLYEGRQLAIRTNARLGMQDGPLQDAPRVAERHLEENAWTCLLVE